MPKLGYISINLRKTEEDELSKQLAELGLTPVSEYPFHVSLMFDETECDEPRCIINSEAIFEAIVIGFKPLGKAIVVELHSIGLQKEFQRLQEAGYTHSYDSLLLHMSLVYNPKPFDLQIIEKGLAPQLIGKTLQFTNETVRDCE